MSITNGYCTLAEFKADKRIQSTDSDDDSVIESIIEDASRMIDYVCNRTFYARTETHYFDIPYALNPRFASMDEWTRANMKSGGLTYGRELQFDDDLISITTFTNGDATTIASTQYNLMPYNEPHKHGLQLKQSSTVSLLPDSNGNTQKVLSIAGSWGYVDRAATDAESVRVISNTKRCCRRLAMFEYLKRFGRAEDTAQITGAGVVITPAGEMPKDAFVMIEQYIKYGLA